MNDEQIEKLLRQAPASKVPAGLVEKLKADIELPRDTRNSRMDLATYTAPSSWARRWLPAISFAIIFLSCVVVFAIQSSTLSQLTQQNSSLRAQRQNLEALRQMNGEVQKLRLENAELDRLRKDNTEMKRLQSEIAKMHEQLAGLESLRAENERLRSQLAARALASNSATKESSETLKEEADSIRCISNLKQIGLAFRLWAGDNNDKYPNDFISMTNELSTWKIMQCPTDTTRKVSSWSDVREGNVSYVRVSTGVNYANNDYVVLVQCPFHKHVLLCDGSVQNGKTAEQHLQVINGLTTFVP